MSRKLNKIAIGTALVTALGAGVAHAVTQGTAGSTSSGTSTITIAKVGTVNITNIDDVAFGNINQGGGPVSGSSDLCVHSTTGLYSITATSANTAGSNFRMKDAGTNFVVYTAEWNDVSGTDVGLVSMTGGAALTTQSGAETTDNNCSGVGGSSARLKVTVSGAEIDAATVASYSDALTLLVAPE